MDAAWLPPSLESPQPATPRSAFKPTASSDPPALRDEAISAMLDRIADRWSILILLSLSDGARSHRVLTQLVPQVTSRVLTLSIRKLCADGLIARTRVTKDALGNEYRLTTLGESLLAPLQALFIWAETHSEALAAAKLGNS
jgi:DNA-binding HxlR family transcriptional regulator